jgi:hypothetical protein
MEFSRDRRVRNLVKLSPEPLEAEWSNSLAQQIDVRRADRLDTRPRRITLVADVEDEPIHLQPNGNDWGVAAFLASQRGLGLDIARDRATTEALLRALPEVALTPVAQLAAGRQLQADDFDRMLAADVVRDLLRWMGDPAGTRARLGANGWAAFRSRCREEIGFDPEIEADVVAGEKLGAGEGAWAAVWERFAEAPRSYGDLAGLLRRSRPDTLPFARERWPHLNDEDEDAVRDALSGLTARPHREACDAVTQLEQDHGSRRTWVWARMELSPMAQVLEPLARLANAVRTALGGTTPDDVAAVYLARGWPGDAAGWEALAAVPPTDERLAADAVRHLLLPWLDDSARAFQGAVARAALPGRGAQAMVEAGEDGCLLFADGLRYDLGQRLAERLEGRGCRVTLRPRWAALPTVTATAKPAVTPVADAVAGRKLGEDFAPVIEKSGQSAGAQVLRAAMQERGYQVLGEGTLDVPMTHPARGWVEAGQIDSLGHTLGSRLARQIDEEIERLVARIVVLLDAGWKSVRVVTDHGWLLLPGGLPKVDLPKHLTASRWSRCAVIAGDATPDVARVPWHWNPGESFATAPGVACFNTSEEYSHGGLSIQECLTPDLLVERADGATAAASITSITWRGLRCFVVAAVRGGPVVADLRVARPTGASAAAAAKRVEADGSVSLVLAGDEHEGAPLVLVLLDEANRILANAPTRAGVDS